MLTIKQIKTYIIISLLLLSVPSITLADTNDRIVYTKCEISNYEDQLTENLYLVNQDQVKQDCVVKDVPNSKIYLATNDTEYNNQWSLKNTGQSIFGQTGIEGIDIGFEIAYPKIANVNQGNTKVAVIDTGVTSISEISGKVLPGYNFVNNSTNANDDQGHGTFVASMIASKVNNSAGIAGVNDKVNILPIKVLDSDGYGYLSDLIQGIQYAIDQNVNIINLSLASGSYDSVLNIVIESAYNEGIIIVAAAGNSGINITTPSVSPLNNDGNKNWVIGVGAIDNRGNRPSYSNYGLGVDVVAPGDDIIAYNQNNSLVYKSGTSMAAAVVTGILAAWRDYYGVLNTDTAHNLINTTSKTGKLISMDGGMINNSIIPPFPNGLLVKSTDSAKVYYIDNGQKRPIESPNMFMSQFKWGDLVVSTPVEIAGVPTGAEMTYRDGSLISRGGVVYVVSEGKRRQIDSSSTFIQKGYKWSNIIAVSEAELNAHPQGEMLRVTDKQPNGSLILGPDGKVYVLREGKRRWIPSPLIFEARYKWESIIAVSQEEINSYVEGENEYYPDGLLIRGSGPKVYMMQGNSKKHIGSPEVFESYGLSWGQIKRATDSEINLIPETGAFSSIKSYKEGSLLGARSSGEIYRVNGSGVLEYIPSANIFISQGYNWNNVLRLSDNVINQYTRSGRIGFGNGALISYNGRTYIIENGLKRWIPNEAIFRARGYSWNNVIPVSEDEFNSNSMGQPLADIQTANLDGYSIPAISGKTAREQHLSLNCSETDSEHYTRANTPSTARNGLLKSGGAFGIKCPDGSINSSYAPFSVEEEKYYITMRWNYVRWYEATSNLTQNMDSNSNRIPLASVVDYPNTGWVIINGEIIAFNGKDGNSLIVSQRGVDSPAVAASPKSHNAGSTVQEVYEYRPDNWRGRTRTALLSNTSQAKNWHRGKKVLVTNPANGKKIIASIMESGPAIFTGRVSGLSPEAMLALGAVTDSNLEYGFVIDQSAPVGPLQ